MGWREGNTTAHFPASETYFSYTYELAEDRIRMSFTGTGKEVTLRLLLPKGRTCREVTLDGEIVSFAEDRIETSAYVVVDTKIKGARELVCLFE